MLPTLRGRAGSSTQDKLSETDVESLSQAQSCATAHRAKKSQKPTKQARPATAGKRSAAGAGGALGNTAIFAAAMARKPAFPSHSSEIVDAETGEVLTVRRGHDCALHVVASPEARRVLKYERKAAAASLLGRKHRIAACHVHPVKAAQSVEVWAKLDSLLPGHFVGLQTCALGWLCPVCSPKIAERRAAEIEAAMAVCKAQGGAVLMPTFTIPHGRHDALASTLDLLKKARRWMTSARQYKNLIAEFQVVGFINATEITHGEANGWHPHFHELWFFARAGVNVDELQERLYQLWLQACRKFGLGDPSRKHGLVVQDGSKAAKYVSKMGEKTWGLSDEIAKANAKAGRGGSRSPWQLLDCYLDEEAKPQHQKRAGALFQEYAEATKGRRQLAWSRGLKKLFAVSEMSDEELCAQVEEEAVLIAAISLADWRIIRRHNLQAHVLNAAQHGSEAVNVLVAYFRKAFQEART